MFCKNCGSNIKEGSGFCPKCGSSIGAAVPAGGGMPLQGFQMMSERPEEKATSRREMGNAGKKIVLILCIVLAAVVVIAGIVALVSHLLKAEEPEIEYTAEEPEIEYTIIGEWVSTEDGSLVNALAALLEEKDMGNMADSMIEFMGLGGKGNINLCFTENGNMYLGMDNVFPRVGSFTYEDMGGNSVMMNYNLDLSAYGFNVPLSLSYKAKYRVNEDGLTIDLFGEKVDFVTDTIDTF